MAWINIAMSFVVSSSPSSVHVMVLWLQAVSGLILAVVVRMLHPLLPGTDIFEGFIQWTIASRILSALNLLSGISSIDVVVSTGILFCILHYALERAVVPFYRDAASSLQAISAIMFTNSVVNAAMKLLTSNSSSPGVVAVALAAGIVLARTLTQIMISLHKSYKKN